MYDNHNNDDNNNTTTTTTTNNNNAHIGNNTYDYISTLPSLYGKRPRGAQKPSRWQKLRKFMPLHRAGTRAHALAMHVSYACVCVCVCVGVRTVVYGDTTQPSAAQRSTTYHSAA